MVGPHQSFDQAKTERREWKIERLSVREGMEMAGPGLIGAPILQGRERTEKSQIERQGGKGDDWVSSEL